MTEEEIDTLFNRNFSAGSEVRYGLMVANMIVEAHDGTFGAYSNNLDEVSSFFIELPLATVEQINTLPHDQNEYWL